ncbi:MAG TPA: PhoH family protein, partial [Paludibacteraceae bacterium]|nr:PhoH family protein [Paludibacteraceae bacterium]
MFELIFELSSHVDTTIFYGINNVNIQLIKNLYPNLKIVARGHIIKIMGSEEEADKLFLNLQKLEQYSIENNKLTEKNIIDLIKDNVPTDIVKYENLILHGSGGKSIIARTKNQQKLVKEFETNDLLFAIGPAGSGKTYTAIALAVRSLKNKEVKRIILSRPAVEAGEKLGFLPGDMKEKIDPY